MIARVSLLFEERLNPGKDRTGDWQDMFSVYVGHVYQKRGRFYKPPPLGTSVRQVRRSRKAPAYEVGLCTLPWPRRGCRRSCWSLPVQAPCSFRANEKFSSKVLIRPRRRSGRSEGVKLCILHSTMRNAPRRAPPADGLTAAVHAQETLCRIGSPAWRSGGAAFVPCRSRRSLRRHRRNAT